MSSELLLGAALGFGSAFLCAVAGARSRHRQILRLRETGRELNADLFVILTGVPKVALDFGKPTQRFVDRLTVAEAEKHLAEGQFPPGSMGPKIESAIEFVKATNKQVLITDVDVLREALQRKDGTAIVP